MEQGTSLSPSSAGSSTPPSSPPTKPGGPLVINSLARLEPNALLNELALADALGVSTRTVRRWVTKGDLPRPFPMGAHRLWLVSTLLAHFKDRTDQARKEQERELARIRRYRD